MHVIMAMDNDNDRSKIEPIFDEYYSLMMYTAKNILNDDALSEDAVSDSFVKLINIVDKIGDISCYKTRSLIVTIVYRTAIDMWRQLKRFDSDMDDEEFEGIADTQTLPIPDEIISIENFNAIKQEIKSLPDSLNDVATLSIVNEFSNQEIADLLKISNSAVRMRLSRAKKIIRDRMAGD